MAVPSFEDELRALIHRCHRETQSDTPEHILAQYILGCLSIFSLITRERDRWHGFAPVHNADTIARDRLDLDATAAGIAAELAACKAKLARVRGFVVQLADEPPGYLTWSKVVDTAGRVLADIDAPTVTTA